MPFQKIKNVDAFEQTIENIKKLRDNSNLSLMLKYIVIKGINDNPEELKSFLNISKDLIKRGCILLEIDFRDTLMNHYNNFKVPNHYKELFNLAENFCKENNILFTIPEYTKKILLGK